MALEIFVDICFAGELREEIWSKHAILSRLSDNWDLYLLIGPWTVSLRAKLKRI